MSKRILAAFIGLGMMLGFSASAHAVSSYATSFKNTYPSSPLSSLSTQSGVSGNLCTVCHGTSGGSRNSFGSAYSSNGRSYTAIQNLDSDGDGFTNLTEINAGTFPGNSSSKPASAACTSYTYSAWSACQSNNTQTRTVVTSLPSGCSGGVAPVTSQACTYVPPVTACTSYTYSAWSACQSNNTQTRTVVTSLPSGCSGGVAPVTSQACTYVPPVTACTSYTYTVGACQSNNTAPVTGYTGIPAGCSGGATPATTQPCTYVPPVTACTSYTYSAWSACQSNSTQTRTVVTSLPAGCSGGTAPVTSQTCTYTPPTPGAGGMISPATSGLYWDDTYKALGIGTAYPEAALHVSDSVTDAGRGILSSQHNDGAQAAYMLFRKSRGSESGPTPPVLNDFIGAMESQAFDGTDYQNTAMIASRVDGNVTQGSVPTAVVFYTGSSIGAGRGERLRITSLGDVGIGTIAPMQRVEVNGGVRLNPDAIAEPKPTCNIDSRGTFWFTQDDVNGDSAEVCARVGGSYAWRRLF